MSTSPVKSILDEQIEEVAGKTLAAAKALASRRGLTAPSFVQVTSGLVVLRFKLEPRP